MNFGLPDLLRPLAPLTQAAAGSAEVPEATPLATLCRRMGIRSVKVDDVNGAEMHRAPRGRADLILTYHFDQILKPETIALARLGGINGHPGLLPRHRGRCRRSTPRGGAGCVRHDPAPARRRHRCRAILDQEAVRMPADVTATRAAILLHQHGARMLDRLLDTVAATGALPEGRMADVLPYCPFPDRAMLASLKRRGLRLTDAADLRGGGEAVAAVVVPTRACAHTRRRSRGPGRSRRRDAARSRRQGNHQGRAGEEPEGRDEVGGRDAEGPVPIRLEAAQDRHAGADEAEGQQRADAHEFAQNVDGPSPATAAVQRPMVIWPVAGARVCG